MTRLVAALAALVAGLDVAQVVLLTWRPKHWGAIGGALLYSALALGASRGSKPALAVLAAVPLIPIGVLVASALGAPLPIKPDAAMIGILTVQLAAASLSVAHLWRNRAE